MKFIALNNSPFVGGGVERVVRKILDNFSNGFKEDLCLLCSDPSREREFRYAGVKCLNLKVPLRGLPDRLFFLGRYYYSYRIYQFLRKLPTTDNFVLNIHGIEYALFPALLRRRVPARMRLVVSVHGSNFDEISQYVVRGLPWKFWPVKLFYYFYRWAHFLAEKWTCRNVDAFTFINEYVRKFYSERYHVEPARGRVIYNGLDVAEPWKRHPKQTGQFRALIVGSTVYRKGLDLAIPIVKKLRDEGYDLRLCVVGFADFQRFSSGKRWDFVDYVGRVTAEQIARYYQEADFLLFPSRFEGFPLTVLEALQYRMPVVVSTPCIFHEVPSHQTLGVIVEGFDREPWSKAVRDNMLNLEKYNRFVDHLNRLNLSSFAWTDIAAAYEEVLAPPLNP